MAGDQEINLNRASREELRQVPGIGPERAEAIVRYRDEQGGFGSVEELDELPGAKGSITRETYGRVTV